MNISRLKNILKSTRWSRHTANHVYTDLKQVVLDEQSKFINN